MHAGIDDPARLAEIVDPERARSATDPTQPTSDDGRHTPVQLADSPHIMNDAVRGFRDDVTSEDDPSEEHEVGRSSPIPLAQGEDYPPIEEPSWIQAWQLLRDDINNDTLFAEVGLDPQEIADWIATEGGTPRPVEVDGVVSALWPLGRTGWFVLATEGSDRQRARHGVGMAPDWLPGVAFVRDNEGRASAYRVAEPGRTFDHSVPLDPQDHAELAGHPLLDRNQALSAAVFGSYARAYSALVRDGAPYSDRFEMAALLDDLYQRLVKQNLLFGGSGPVDD